MAPGGSLLTAASVSGSGSLGSGRPGPRLGETVFLFVFFHGVCMLRCSEPGDGVRRPVPWGWPAGTPSLYPIGF